MIFELYKSVNDLPETQFTKKENTLKEQLMSLLLPFPIHRIRVRTDYSINKNEISIDIELDSILNCEIIYNKIAHRIFRTLQLNLISLQNRGIKANFSYFFYGEKSFLGYDCSIFVDVPKKAYISKRSNFNKH